MLDIGAHLQDHKVFEAEMITYGQEVHGSNGDGEALWWEDALIGIVHFLSLNVGSYRAL